MYTFRQPFLPHILYRIMRVFVFAQHQMTVYNTAARFIYIYIFNTIHTYIGTRKHRVYEIIPNFPQEQ